MGDEDDTWSTADEAVTADEQRRGRSLDDRLAEETRRDDDPNSERQIGELVDDGGPDTEPSLVSEVTTAAEPGVAESDEDTAGFAADTGWAPEIEEDSPPAEELAVTVRDEAPGGTDDESDGYVDDEGSS